MATSRAVLRRRLMEGRGVYLALTTTSAGNVGGTTLVAAAIVNQDPATVINKWVFLTSGANNGQARRITGISGSTVTVASAFGAQVASGVTLEVLAYAPDDIHAAINAAAHELYPDLYTPVSDESIIVDGLLTNPSFDSFESGAFPGWTAIGTPTLALTPGGAAQIEASGGTEGLRQDVSVRLASSRQLRLWVRGWVYATDADVARIRLTFDGSTYINSAWHSGDGKWRLLDINAIVPDDATEATVSVEVEDGYTAEFDLIAATGDPLVRYALPVDFISSPHAVYQQARRDELWGEYEPLVGSVLPRSGYVLRLTTRKGLGEVASDTDEMQVEEPRTSVLIAKATAVLHRILAARNEGSQRDFHREEQAAAENEVATLLAKPGVRMPRMAAQMRANWQFLADEGGRWLLLTRGRA